MSTRRKNGTSIKDYQRVEAFKRKNPTLSTSEALRKLGVTESAYYRGQRYTRGTKSPRRASEQHVAVQPMPADSGKLMVLIGTIEQIRGVIS